MSEKIINEDDLISSPEIRSPGFFSYMLGIVVVGITASVIVGIVYEAVEKHKAAERRVEQVHDLSHAQLIEHGSRVELGSGEFVKLEALSFTPEQIETAQDERNYSFVNNLPVLNRPSVVTVNRESSGFGIIPGYGKIPTTVYPTSESEPIGIQRIDLGKIDKDEINVNSLSAFVASDTKNPEAGVAIAYDHNTERLFLDVTITEETSKNMHLMVDVEGLPPDHVE